MRKISVLTSKRMMKKLGGNRKGISAAWSKRYKYFYVDLDKIRLQIVPNYFEKGLWGVEVISYMNQLLTPGCQDYKNIPRRLVQPVVETAAALFDGQRKPENIDLAQHFTEIERV
jgi:hypothetical protein